MMDLDPREEEESKELFVSFDKKTIMWYVYEDIDNHMAKIISGPYKTEEYARKVLEEMKEHRASEEE